MSLPTSVAEIVPYRVRKFMNLAGRAHEETIIDLLGCEYCGAPAGRYCVNRRGKPGRLPHICRRSAAAQWRKGNRDEWARMRDNTFMRLVRLEKIR